MENVIYLVKIYMFYKYTERPEEKGTFSLFKYLPSKPYDKVTQERAADVAFITVEHLHI